MSRRSGIRFADKDMRQLWNLRRFPFIWDHRVIPYEWKTLWSAMDRGFIRCYPARHMTDLSLTILAETANDAQAIERLNSRTFGPGRFVLSSYRLREHVDHRLDLSFTAWIGTLLVGSVRQLPISIGDWGR
jgi:hypothetical protein